MKLTVDKNGNDATSADFDPANIVQWGFDMQWADDRSDTEATLFGASSVVGADGKTAQITDQFATGLKWFNDGVWKDHFIPTKPAIDSDLLGKGNPFQSGNLAMAETHSWYMCCINPAAPAKPSFTLGRRGRPVLQRRHDRQGPRRHVQHPQHDQEPGRGLHGPRRPGRSRPSCSPTTAPSRPIRPSSSSSSTRSRPTTRTRRSTGPSAGDARVRRQAQPPGLDAGLPEVPIGPEGRLQQVPHH